MPPLSQDEWDCAGVYLTFAFKMVDESWKSRLSPSGIDRHRERRDREIYDDEVDVLE